MYQLGANQALGRSPPGVRSEPQRRNLLCILLSRLDFNTGTLSHCNTVALLPMARQSVMLIRHAPERPNPPPQLSMCLGSSVADFCHDGVAGAAHLTHTAAAPTFPPMLTAENHSAMSSSSSGKGALAASSSCCSYCACCAVSMTTSGGFSATCSTKCRLGSLHSTQELRWLPDGHSHSQRYCTAPQQ